MRTKENPKNKSDLKRLTEEIKNLRSELKSSNKSIKILSTTVKELRGDRVREPKTRNNNKARRVNKTLEIATFQKDNRVFITNKIRQHINIATRKDRKSTVTGVSLNRLTGHPNQIFITTDNGFETWRDPKNLRALTHQE